MQQYSDGLSWVRRGTTLVRVRVTRFAYKGKGNTNRPSKVGISAAKRDDEQAPLVSLASLTLDEHGRDDPGWIGKSE